MLKKMSRVFWAFLIVFSIFVQPIRGSAEVNALKIHVSLEGNDNNDGSEEFPLRSINTALEIAKDKMKYNSVEVILHEGEYCVKQVHMNKYKAGDGNALTIKGVDIMNM